MTTRCLTSVGFDTQDSIGSYQVTRKVRVHLAGMDNFKQSKQLQAMRGRLATENVSTIVALPLRGANRLLAAVCNSPERM